MRRIATAIRKHFCRFVSRRWLLGSEVEVDFLARGTVLNHALRKAEAEKIIRKDRRGTWLRLIHNGEAQNAEGAGSIMTDRHQFTLTPDS